jgi:hypothetical protein
MRQDASIGSSDRWYFRVDTPIDRATVQRTRKPFPS